MSFSETLENYFQILGCSNQELAASCGISASTLSRYRTGTRTPGIAMVESLAHGIAQLNRTAGADLGESYSEIKDNLINALKAQELTDVSTVFPEKLDLLMKAFAISNSEMAHFVSIDPSYLSRLRNGHRSSANNPDFIRNCALFAARRCVSQEEEEQARILLGDDTLSLNENTLAAALTRWLQTPFESDGKSQTDEFLSFLRALDEFDLNEYIESIHFNDIKVPTAPFSLPTSKFYYGIEQMRQGELDFLKTTALSKESREFVMCSDMPIDEMAKDIDFNKKWMFGLAALLKRGIRIVSIHNVNRPFHEMMLGLESWIPLYMTGLVTPYYLKGDHNKLYTHLNYVSEAAALGGEGIADKPLDSRYYLTKKKDEVSYYRRKMDNILEQALPLMEMYREDDAARMSLFNTAERVRASRNEARCSGEGMFKNMKIALYPNECVVISKTTPPAIHFVIHNPQLIDAIARLVPAVVE